MIIEDSPQNPSASPPPDSSKQGGISIGDNPQITVGSGDVVGRNKIEVGGHVINVKADRGSTVSIDLRPGLQSNEALEKYLGVLEKELQYVLLPLPRKLTNSGLEYTNVVDIEKLLVPLSFHARLVNQSDDTTSSKADASDKLEAQTMQSSAFETPVLEVRLTEILNNNNNKCIFFLGQQGAGKTTLLKRIGLAFLKEKTHSDFGYNGGSLVPLFIRLRDLMLYLKSHSYIGSSDTEVVNYLETRFSLDSRISKQLLDDGKCLILLDGLDEITEDRDELATYMVSFIRNCIRLGNRVCLSSRPVIEDTMLMNQLRGQIKNLSLVDIPELTSEIRTQLIYYVFRAWKWNDNIDVVDKQAKTLCAQIEQDKIRNEIVVTPLICSFAVAIYINQGELPQRRTDFYEQVIILLLGQWKMTSETSPSASKIIDLILPPGISRTPKSYDDAIDIKKTRFAHIAYWMQEKGYFAITYNDAVAVLKDFIVKRERIKGKETEEQAEAWATGFLDFAIERREIWFEKGNRLYEFYHRAFQECLAVVALINREESELKQTCLDHLHEQDWREVISLAITHKNVPEAVRSNFIEALITVQKDEATFFKGVELATRSLLENPDSIRVSTQKLLEGTLLRMAQGANDSSDYAS